MLTKKILPFIASIAVIQLVTPNNAFALMWNDPDVVPVQSISDHRWRDAKTGRLINVTGMPDVSSTPTTPTPTTPSSTSTLPDDSYTAALPQTQG